MVNIFKKSEPTMTWRESWFLWMLRHIPQHSLSRLAGCLANLERPVWLKNRFISYYRRRYNITLDEAIEKDPLTYVSFNAFFTRQLTADARPIASSGMVSPVDGTVSQAGDICEGKIFQAKGKDYNLLSLLGGREQWVEPFKQGQFATLYLSPKDYHRVHMPLDGKLLEMIHVPGHLFSVNPTSVAHQPELFARNERVICIFETRIGPMAMIMVGAMIVGSISAVWCGQVTPPQGYDVYSWPYASKDAPSLAKGEQMGHFQLGSTVIILLPNHELQLMPELKAGATLKFGEQIAR